LLIKPSIALLLTPATTPASMATTESFGDRPNKKRISLI
jgi:hypothetical protein